MLLKTPRHHLFRDPASESLILIIESDTTGSQNQSFINSHSRSATGAITAHPGKTLGAGVSKLLITRVSPGLMIETLEFRHAGDPGLWRYFTIGTDLKFIPIASGIKKFVDDGIRALPWHAWSGPVSSNRVEILENDLTLLFADKSLPSWARSILDAQLEFWNVHHVENYYRFMPGKPIGPEFARCIVAAPFWALARWKTDLYPDQRNYCMQRSPAGAVAFCVEKIPPGRRPQMLAQNPEAALRLGFERLEEKDIAVCVKAAPSMALAMARGFTPTARARLLGSVIKHCKRELPFHTTELQTAIFESIEESPESWLEIFGDSFIPAFEKMDRNLGIRPSGEILIEFSKKFASDKQARLLEVVADWI
jgi:hypothetical protein